MSQVVLLIDIFMLQPPLLPTPAYIPQVSPYEELPGIQQLADIQLSQSDLQKLADIPLLGNSLPQVCLLLLVFLLIFIEYLYFISILVNSISFVKRFGNIFYFAFYCLKIAFTVQLIRIFCLSILKKKTCFCCIFSFQF